MRAEKMGTQQVKNLASAIRLWVKIHGFVLDRNIGDELGKDFDHFFIRFCDAMAETLAPRTQRDRQEQVIRWRRIAANLRACDTLPQSFSEALTICVSSSPLPKATIAREAGIAVPTLQNWMNGTQLPRLEHSLTGFGRLETVLELSPGTLLNKVPLMRRNRYQRGEKKSEPLTSYGKLRRQQIATIPPYVMQMTPRLNDQWQDLLRFKTDTLRPGARARNTWRVKKIERTSLDVRPSAIIDGHVCVTGSVQFGMVSSYLGWLKLDAPIGAGISDDDVQTIAWLTKSDYVIRYAKWLMRRSGNLFHNGVNVFLQTVESHLRPESGYIWLNPELMNSLPQELLRQAMGQPQGTSDEATNWKDYCRRERATIREFRERARDTHGLKRSREPAERLATVLNDAFPLKVLVNFVETLERSVPPPSHLRDYRAWLRDIVLCRFLLTNPIRIGQYAAMTFRTDGTGNLVKLGAGRYRLNFSPSDFKNEKGAASQPYSVEVDSILGVWLDRYFSEARPYLYGADLTDRVFLATVPGPRKEKEHLTAAGLVSDIAPSAGALYVRIRLLTSTYIENCPGFGPHAFRHAIATDHLRRHPGDYLTVATLLHDKLETVLKNYSHLTAQDGLRQLSNGVHQASQELAEMRRKK